MKITGFAALSGNGKVSPIVFERREAKDNDVVIEILYCGICHSDLHTINGDWGDQTYPLVPGHEIVGVVKAVGSQVSQFAVGDNVAVGCMVDSCLHCDQCKKGEEQYCREGMTPTYGAPDKLSGGITQGGYSEVIVVKEEFVLKIPTGMALAKAAPILCAGITTYSPLKKWGVTQGTRLAVVGLGGLGHMAVKLAVAMGAEVTVISRSLSKLEDIKALGAKTLLSSKDSAEMSKHANAFDLIIDTVPVKHDINIYTPLLDIDGSLVIIGQIGDLNEPSTAPLVFGRRKVTGSLIGGIKETQEVLDFCAKNDVYPDCKIISSAEINQALARLADGDISYRFVIDMKQ